MGSCRQKSAEVTFDNDSEFFQRPKLSFADLADNFVEAGATGTLNNRRNKGKQNKGDDKAKPREKLLDIPLTRVQFLGKLATAAGFCEGSLRQALEKSESFYCAQPTLTEKFLELKSQGVTEDRVLDKSLQLGTQAGILKCFFALQKRVQAASLALGREPDEPLFDEEHEVAEDADCELQIVGDGNSGDGQQDAGTGASSGSAAEAQENVKADRMQKMMTRFIKQDHAMKVYAGNAACVPWLRKNDLFDECVSRQGFKDRLKLLQDRAGETKVLAQSVRKCVTEMDTLIKARVGQSVVLASTVAM